MFLSNQDVLRYIAAGQITIHPFDESRLKGADYLCKLGSKLWLPNPNLPAIAIDEPLPSNAYREYDLNKEGPVTLLPNQFCLGQTFETISISVGHVALLVGRTEMARRGLDVLSGTSLLVEPGQTNSHEVLEIRNNGPWPLILKPNVPIVKIVFILLQNKASIDYGQTGRHRHQQSPQGKKNQPDLAPPLG